MQDRPNQSADRKYELEYVHEDECYTCGLRKSATRQQEVYELLARRGPPPLTNAALTIKGQMLQRGP